MEFNTEDQVLFPAHLLVCYRSPCGVAEYNPTGSKNTSYENSENYLKLKLIGTKPPILLNKLFTKRFSMNTDEPDIDDTGSDVPELRTHYPEEISPRTSSPSSQVFQSEFQSLSYGGSVKGGVRPPSPMFCNLFSAKLNDYVSAKESVNKKVSLPRSPLSKTSSLIDSNCSTASPTSSMDTPFMRDFRKKTSPSLLNLKSPQEVSSRNSPTMQRFSPSPRSLPTSGNNSFDSARTSPTPNSSNTSPSQSFLFTNIDLGKMSSSVLSLNNTTTFSPLSKSLVNIAKKPRMKPSNKPPLSPLVSNNYRRNLGLGAGSGYSKSYSK